MKYLKSLGITFLFFLTCTLNSQAATSVDRMKFTGNGFNTKITEMTAITISEQNAGADTSITFVASDSDSQSIVVSGYIKGLQRLDLYKKGKRVKVIPDNPEFLSDTNNYPDGVFVATTITSVLNTSSDTITTNSFPGLTKGKGFIRIIKVIKDGGGNPVDLIASISFRGQNYRTSKASESFSTMQTKRFGVTGKITSSGSLL